MMKSIRLSLLLMTYLFFVVNVFAQIALPGQLKLNGKVKSVIEKSYGLHNDKLSFADSICSTISPNNINEYYFRKDGKCIKTKDLCDVTYYWTYNDKGQLVMQEGYDTDKSLLLRHIYEYQDTSIVNTQYIIYNADTLIVQDVFDAQGRVKKSYESTDFNHQHITDYIYNDDGQLVKKVEDGEFLRNYNMYYDKEGYLQKIVLEVNGRPGDLIYYYNKHGDLEKSINEVIWSEDKTSRFITNYFYDYDKYGNWIKCIALSRSTFNVVIRDIEYY